ncbi:MAG: hypothetical protein IKN12_09440 [Selenomonadaceae bacterium]|nr:hypothetical protein [Selenomonadaceae bacterium]
MFKVKAKIHSLNGELREVTIVKENGYNDVVAEYRGSYYTAVFNPFVGCYFVDDKYGYIGDCKKSR